MTSNGPLFSEPAHVVKPNAEMYSRYWQTHSHACIHTYTQTHISTNIGGLTE